MTEAVDDWSGGTRIGESFREFNLRWARRVLRSSGSSWWSSPTAGIAATPGSSASRRRASSASCHRLVWLNPLAGDEGYEPLAAGMAAAYPFIDDCLPMTSVASLERLGTVLGGLGLGSAGRPPRTGTPRTYVEAPRTRRLVPVRSLPLRVATQAGGRPGEGCRRSELRPPPGAEEEPVTAADPTTAWAARVLANREQSERVRETPPDGDFYAPVSTLFVADPRRTDDPTCAVLRSLVRPGETWLDIGAGAGRFALPLALLAGEVVAVEPSPAMLGALREGMRAHGIENVRPVEARWPPDDPALVASVRADVALIAHLGYDVPEIGPFLDAMEAAARRLCVAVLAERAPSWRAGPFWPIVHGEPRRQLPGLSLFLDVLRARGRVPAVSRVDRPSRSFRSREDLVRWLRNQLFVAEGSERDRRLLAAMERRTTTGPDGLGLRGDIPVREGIVTWAPR